MSGFILMFGSGDGKHQREPLTQKILHSLENSCHWVLDAICREDHNQTRDRNAASNLSTLRRIALNAHNLMPFEGKKRKSLPKRELRAASQTGYLENLLPLM
jgi:hypothetical protein